MSNLHFMGPVWVRKVSELIERGLRNCYVGPPGDQGVTGFCSGGSLVTETDVFLMVSLQFQPPKENLLHVS